MEMDVIIDFYGIVTILPRLSKPAMEKILEKVVKE